ncbi:hypothetical protein BC833DRAFT_662351 [Globomyces pollinis-pini]|nr:hypothetical protein BC833DRAFT_662351 [Globomyces pollinis-pini]
MQTGFLDLHQPAAKVEDVKNFMPIFSPEFGVSTATMWKNLGNLDKLDITKNKRSYLYLLKVLDKLTKLRHEPPLPKNNPFDDNRLPTLLQSQNSISPLITEVVEPENVANNTSSDVVNNYRASSLSPMLERPRLGDPPRSRINILTATHQELLSLLDPRPLSERELSTRASTDQNIRSQNNIVLPANEISSIPQTEQVSENNTQAKSRSNELSKSDEGSEGDDGEEFEVKNVIDVKLNKNKKTNLYFQIEWVESKSPATWEKYQNLNCPLLIQSFIDQLCLNPGNDEKLVWIYEYFQSEKDMPFLIPLNESQKNLLANRDQKRKSRVKKKTMAREFQNGFESGQWIYDF